MTDDILQVQSALRSIEQLGEQFLDVRKQGIACDKQRNDAREAQTALRKRGEHGSVWLMRPGGVMMKLPTATAQSVLAADQVELEQRAAEVRREEKRLVSLLAAKGAAPGSLGPGTLEALLRLKG